MFVAVLLSRLKPVRKENHSWVHDRFPEVIFLFTNIWIWMGCLMTNHSYKYQSECKLRGKDGERHRTGVGFKNMRIVGGLVEVFGQSGNESVMLCKRIGFTVGKKLHVRVQNAIRSLCAAEPDMTLISLSSIHIQWHDEKDT